MNKSPTKTSFVRKVDDLGRVVIPKELRKTLGIDIGTPMAISMEGKRIVMSQYKYSCVFCGDDTDLQEFRGRMVCAKCREKLRTQALEE